MEKLTDAEIVTGLEHCSGSMDCDNCNIGITTNCVGDLLKYALDLIYRKDAENEKLKSEHREMKRLIKEASNGFELLQVLHAQCVEQAKSEAYKEFAEKVKDATFHYYDSEIDDVYKILTGGNDAKESN